jgi:hypothetical protein
MWKAGPFGSEDVEGRSSQSLVHSRNRKGWTCVGRGFIGVE